jgi:ketosteroid isomerase-like protein
MFFVYHGRGEHSGAEVATPATSVAQWRDGVLTHSTVYLDRAQALRDLGVTEDELGTDRAVTDSANVELVRSIYADWEHGDYSSTDWAHPEIETVMADGPAPGSWTGLAGMTAALQDVTSAWEDWHAGAEEYRELDDERMIVLTRRGGRGKTSGLEIGEMRTKGAVLFHIRDGKVTRLVIYWDRDRALADLGAER